MRKSKTEAIIIELFKDETFNLELPPGEFVDYFYNKYLKVNGSNNSVNGTIFENILTTLLIREGIKPVYGQASLAFVPNVIFDLVLYNRKTPIVLSAKTSLRERWKQADIEAMALKYVHRRAKCYVLTMSESEVSARRKEQNSYVGIDKFILAHTSELDELIKELKEIEISESETIDIIENHEKHIVTEDLLKEKFGVSFE